MRCLAGIGIILLASALVGCSGSEAGRPCTEIGASSGISVTVLPPLPSQRTMTLTVCTTPDSCTEEQVELRAGSDVIDEGCRGTGPDAPCSARATPNGTLVGFVAISDLAPGPVTISASFGTSATTPADFGPTEVTAELVYPNGPDCGAAGPQAHITFTGKG